MEEMQSDSGVSPGKQPIAERVFEQFKRPAIWGLLLLVAIVLMVQIWLLYL